MTLQAIGKSSFLIIVSQAELSENEMSAKNITKADAEKLYRLALPKMNGNRNSASVFLEVYEGKNEIMIFVRFSGDEIAVFAFDDFEDMLTAVSFCPEMCSSELLYDGERYILMLTPWDGDPIPEIVYEFGEKLNISSLYLPWLREHCVRIIPGKAIETLLNVF